MSGIENVISHIIENVDDDMMTKQDEVASEILSQGIQIKSTEMTSRLHALLNKSLPQYTLSYLLNYIICI